MQDDLITKIAVKNKKALEHLYNRYERTVYLFAYRIAGHPKVAEEIVNKLFMKIWESEEKVLKSNQKLSVQMLQMTKEIAYNQLHTPNPIELASATIEEN